MDNDAIGRLAQRYLDLAKTDRNATVLRVAKIVTGASVVRVFDKGTARRLVDALVLLDLEKFAQCKTDEEFDKFFFLSLDQIDEAIDKRSRRNDLLGEGRKWGHASKVLCLFLRDLVLYSRYFRDDEVRRLQNLLYMPLDSVVMKHLRSCGVSIKARQIKDISSCDEFQEIQRIFTVAAKHANVPRILFDNVWSQGL